MSKGVQFDRKSAERIAAATRRVEQTPRGGNIDRRGSHDSLRPVFFVLNEDLDAATDSLTGAFAARANVYASDPANPPVMAADRSTYTPQELTTSTPARVEWVVNRWTSWRRLVLPAWRSGSMASCLFSGLTVLRERKWLIQKSLSWLLVRCRTTIC